MADWRKVEHEVTNPDGSTETLHRLIAPNDVQYTMPDEAAAIAIFADLDSMARELKTLRDDKAEAWLTATEEAREQRAAEMLDHFRQVDALNRSARANRT